MTYGRRFYFFFSLRFATFFGVFIWGISPCWKSINFFRFVSKMRDELFKRERRSFLSVWKITILFTPSHGISKTWDIILPLKSFSYKTPTYRGIISRKYFLKYINLTNCRFFRDHGLADTGEDSKLGHRWKRPEVARYFLLFFSDASERRVWRIRVFACIG